MDIILEVDSNGLRKNGYQIRNVESYKTLSEIRLDSDGLLKSGHQIKGAKAHKTLSEIVLDSDGLLKSRYQIRVKNTCKRLKENVQRKDGKMRTGHQQMGHLGKVLHYLKKLENESDTLYFHDCVKLWPILSGASMD
ncbi:unnamed protein product, partial [Rotaria sordida]